MAAKMRSSFSRVIMSLVLLIPNITGFLQALTRGISREARLASKSLVEIIVLAFMLGSLITSTWLGLLIFLYEYFLSLTASWKCSFALVLLLNVLLMVMICVWMNRLKRNLLFLKTRKRLHLEDNSCESCEDD